MKYAKQNQPTVFVRYNRVFVITIIVIPKFDYKWIATLVRF